MSAFSSFEICETGQTLSNEAMPRAIAAGTWALQTGLLYYVAELSTLYIKILQGHQLCLRVTQYEYTSSLLFPISNCAQTTYQFLDSVLF